MHKVPRRHVLVQGARATTLLSAAALARALGFTPTAQALDWSDLLGTRQTGGAARVRALRGGTAFAAETPLAEGDMVTSGVQVRVTRGAVLVLAMTDESLFRITGPAVTNLELGQDTGLVNVVLGGLLAVVNPGRRYVAQLPTATIGIKGTVLFAERFERSTRSAMGMEGPVPIPDRVDEYFCLCRGEAEYLRAGRSTPFFTDDAQHHNPYFVDPRQPELLRPSEMVNHSDEEIDAIIRMQQGPQHAREWLELG